MPMIFFKYNDKKFKLTHRIIFGIGWFYYLMIPIFAIYFGLFEDVKVWSNYISDDFNYPLVSYGILVIIAYTLGSSCAKINWKTSLYIKYSKLISWIFIPAYYFLFLYFTFAARQFIFTGYQNGVDASLVGPIATLEMALLFHYLFCKIFNNSRPAILTGILLLLTSIILLSMGGRIYVLSALTSIVFYAWNWGNVNRRRLIIIMILALCIVVGLGMWRVGDFNTEVISFYIFAESLFTSISAFTLFQGGGWNWFDYPSNFIISFLNIIPVLLWPDKSFILDSWSTVYPDIEAPFGALNIVASSVSNFGYLGGLFFIGLVGFIMELIQKISKYPLIRALYCYLVGLLPFIFFRDPYTVQVKLVLMAFVLTFFYGTLAKIKFFKLKNYSN
jgi:hypothetical protein